MVELVNQRGKENSHNPWVVTEKYFKIGHKKREKE